MTEVASTPERGSPPRRRPVTHLRRVGGTLLDAVVADSEHARVEVLRRGSSGHITWQLQQPSSTLFWCPSGVHEALLQVDGIRLGVVPGATNELRYFPAGAHIEGEFSVDPIVTYILAFVDPHVVADYGVHIPDHPLTGPALGPLRQGLHDLAHDARQPDAATALLVEGWALQSIAHLARIGTADDGAPTRAEPGLPFDALARVEQYVHDHLSESITVDQLAQAAGFSRRHFLRAFQQRTGRTPMRHVLCLRLEEAKLRLSGGDEQVTAIALACGFSHAQHLATVFRRVMGVTPSQFRVRSQTFPAVTAGPRRCD
ncbi:helix-turn-helix domain-containing protein [Streptomyces sp. NPDC057746]|uniref:AraC family transcriptional regulator n=1 Tax=unclassified Streptomyces TaxID=2593676 RepID=UPI0033BA0186